MVDRSRGYEGVAREFLARRGSGRSTGVGVNAVRQWAQTLPHGAAVIDLGCGPGFPITEVLVAEGLDVFAVDAAPSFSCFLPTSSGTCSKGSPTYWCQVAGCYLLRVRNRLPGTMR